MKKFSKLFVAIMVGFIAMGVARATDLTSVTGNGKLTANDYLGGKTEFTYTYHDWNDLNVIDVKVTIDQDIIDTVLAHKPGNENVGGEAMLGVYYFSIDPQLTDANFKKENVTVSGTLAEAMDEVNKKLDETGDTSTYSSVYAPHLFVQYFKDGKWNLITAKGTGDTTIGEALIAAIGNEEITDASELTYGKDYRLVLPSDSYLFGFEDSNDKREYVEVFFYHNNFPIYGIDDTGETIFYETVNQAIESGANFIGINGDVTEDSSIVIPEGVMLEINTGATLTLTGDAKLIVNGDLYNYGTIIENGVTLYAIHVYTNYGGKVTVDTVLVKEGDKVNVKVLPDDGYKLDTIKVISLVDGMEDKNVKLNDDYSFIMPGHNVNLVASFTKNVNETVTTPMPPKTGDINLFNIIGIVVIASMGIIISRKKIIDNK